MQITKSIYDKLTKLRSGYLDDKGHEILNPRPLVVQSGIKRKPSLQEQIKRVLKVELSRQAENQDMETFDDSQDFNISDDFDMEELQTQYELVEEEYPIEIEKPAEPEPEVQKNEPGETEKEVDQKGKNSDKAVHSEPEKGS